MRPQSPILPSSSKKTTPTHKVTAPNCAILFEIMEAYYIQTTRSRFRDWDFLGRYILLETGSENDLLEVK